MATVVLVQPVGLEERHRVDVAAIVLKLAKTDGETGIREENFAGGGPLQRRSTEIIVVKITSCHKFA